MFPTAFRIIENWRFTENTKVKYKTKILIWESKESVWPDKNKWIYKDFHSLTPVVTSVTFRIQLKFSEKHKRKIKYFVIATK